MAIWQFTVWFVPSEIVGDRSFLTEQESEKGAWQGTKQPPPDFCGILESILPRAKSWHRDLLQWGTQEGDLIEVWLDGGKVVSLEVRIDCRSLNAAFIRRIFNISLKWGFRLVCGEGLKVLPRDMGGFVRAIWDSPNHKVLEAPQELLPKLAKEVAEHDKP